MSYILSVGRSAARCLRASVISMMLVGSMVSHAQVRPYRFITRTPGVVDYWPRFSPNGTSILFSRCRISTGCGGATTSGHWELWTVPRRGGEATVFIARSDVSATRSNWLWNTDVSIATPIAFTGVSMQAGDARLWLSDTAGAAPFPVETPADVASGYPSWFPDGSAVSVSGQPKASSAPYISVVSVPGGHKIAQLTSIDSIWTGESAVSRNGSQIAFAGQLPIAENQYSDANNEIWIESINPSIVPASDAFDPNLHPLDGLQGRTPDWSPNDRFLIFESTRGCLDGHYAIFIEAATGGKAIQVTDCKLDANHAVWSPDGRRFAFSGVFGNKKPACEKGCRGIAIAPVPARIQRLGTVD